MALRYWYGEDEFGGPVEGLDDTGEHFWSGVFRAAAPIAVATALAATALSTQVAAATATPSDEVIASFSPDEDYTFTVLNVPRWQSAWYAGTATPPAPLPIDDDTWQPWLTPPPDPVLYLVAPWAWGSAADDIAQLIGLDEDSWQQLLPQPTVVNTVPALWSAEQHDTITIGQAEEELWTNPVRPQALTYAPLWPWALDPQDELSVPGQPDEDFWQSGVAPIILTLTWPQQYTYEQWEQAFGLVPPPAPPSFSGWVHPVYSRVIPVRDLVVSPLKVQPGRTRSDTDETQDDFPSE